MKIDVTENIIKETNNMIELIEGLTFDRGTTYLNNSIYKKQIVDKMFYNNLDNILNKCLKIQNITPFITNDYIRYLFYDLTQQVCWWVENVKKFNNTMIFKDKNINLRFSNIIENYNEIIRVIENI